jgi:AraC-like DNA-binding protein
MSMMRRADPPIRGYAVTHPRGAVTMPTQAGWQQVVYAVSGVVVARTHDEQWTLPPHRALCIGEDRRIELRTRQRTAIRTLYLHRDLEALAPTVRVVDVPPLARELLLRAVETSPLELDDERSAALYRLLVAELTGQRTVPLRLPLPTDPRARQLAEDILAAPHLRLDEVLAGVPAARRTCERLVRRDTGLTLAGWQRRARVLHAIELLALGASVTRAAAEVGYSTPSAFVVAFRSETGSTPTQLLAARRAG